MIASQIAEPITTDDLPVPVVLEIRDSAEWYVAAITQIELLLHGPIGGNFKPVPMCGVQADILQHAKAHLERRLRAYLCPSDLPRTEQQAMVMLMELGQELAFAAEELDIAAQALKFAGKANAASRTKQASTRTKQVAEGLLD